MKTIALDVHQGCCQLAAYSQQGEMLLELKVPTTADELRRVVRGIPGPKRVVFEEGSLSGLIYDALAPEVDEIISCDATRNALIGRAEDSNDEKDAQRLALLARAGALHAVYVPPEPFRTWRSLVRYEHSMTRAATSLKNRIKGLCRRYGLHYEGKEVYRSTERGQVLKQLPSMAVRWQMNSLYRRLDELRTEQVGAHRILGHLGKTMPVLKRLKTIPGFGALTARTVVAWIVDPSRFTSRKALSSYAGLGLGQSVTGWKPVGRTRASRRGKKELKRVLFIAARVASQCENALARRYQARREAGWEDRKAIRDVARTLLFIARAVWLTGKEYRDENVAIPSPQN